MKRKTNLAANPLSALAATMTLGLAFTFGAHAQTMGPGGGTSPAPPDKPSIESTFKRMDADKDGSLSVQEASRMPALVAQFGELDTNKDGVLSQAEFSAAYSATY